MKKRGLIFGVKMCLLSVLCCFLNVNISFGIQQNALQGKKIFEGSQSLLNGGPACISCHNVNHPEVMSGGLLAKDLTKVYDRMGEGLAPWLSAPPFPAMVSSYKEHPLTEKERNALAAFFKEVTNGNETPVYDGHVKMLVGGFVGLGILLVWISLIWYSRKKGTVKQQIFDRQSRAWDAKY